MDPATGIERTGFTVYTISKQPILWKDETNRGTRNGTLNRGNS
jgi:hypothetical protein